MSRQQDSGISRQRPGRVRRWLVRPLAWLLAVVALLVLLIWLLLQSSWLRNQVEAHLEAYLEQHLDREVSIGELDFELVPPSVVVHDFAIADLRPDLPPAIQLETLRASFDVFLAQPRQLDLRYLELVRPIVRLRLLPDGGNNMPEWEGGGGGEREFQVEIGTVRVRHGEFRLEAQRIPLDFAAHDVSARLSGIPGELGAQGQVSVSRFRLLLPDGEPYLGRVSGEIAVERGRLEIRSAQITGPRLEAQAEGTVEWGKRSQAQIDFEARAMGALLDELGYLEGEIRGEYRFAGELLWQPGTWDVRARIASRRADLFDWPVEEFRGRASVDASAFHLDVNQGRFGGGTLDGEFEIDLEAAGRPTRLRLQLQSVSLQELAAGLGLPVQDLGGRVSGPLTVSFPLTQPQQMSGRAQLSVAEGSAGGDRVPFHGSIPVRFREGVVKLPETILVSQNQGARIAGSYDLAESRGRFEYRVELNRMGRFGELLPLEPSPQPPAWLPTQAQGTIEGSVRVRPSSTQVRVNLELQDVRAPGLEARQLAGSLLLGDAGVSRLRLEAQRPEGALLVTGTVPYEDDPADDLDFAIEVDAAGWPLRQARAWVPFPLPLDGRLTGTVSLGGSLESPTGRLDARLEPARVGEWSGGELTAQIQFQPERIWIQRAVWSSAAGEVVASGTISGPESRLDIDVDSGSLLLGKRPLAKTLGPDLGGSVDLHAHLGGTLEQPEARLSAHSSALWATARPERKWPLEVTAEWQNQSLSVAASLGELLRVQGGGPLTLESAEMRFDVGSSALGTLARLAAPQVPSEFRGSTTGSVEALKRPGEDGVVSVELPRLELAYQQLELQALEPVRVRWMGDAIQIQSLYLGDPEGTSEVFAAGTVGLGEAASLGLNVQASLEASWFEVMLPELQIGGRLEVLGRVGGTLTDPRINGQAAIHHGSILSADLPDSIEEIQGLVLFYPRQIVVDHVTAELGGGDLRLTGTVDPQDLSYRLELVADGVTLSYPPGWRLRGGAELVLASIAKGRVIRGVIHLERAFYLRDVEVGPVQLLQQFLRRQPVRFAETDEFLAGTQLQIQIEGVEALRVRNNLASLNGSIDLVVRGTLAQPVLFGTVEVEPGSTFTYAGNEYRVTRGQLTFANPYRIEPYIDLVAETEIRDYDVTLDLSGSVKQPVVSFRSSPPLAELDVLSLLATGEASGANLFADAQTEESGAAQSFLYGQAASVVSQRVNALFGLDKLQIHPLTGASGAISAARVTVGEQLSKNVYATYSYDPTSTAVQILQVEWQATRHLAVVLTQNGDSSYAVDFEWETRF